MAQKLLVMSKAEAVALIAAAGGFEGSNDPMPVMMGRMDGERENAHWVEAKEQLRFRGMPVWQFSVAISQISSMNGIVRPDTLRILFPNPTKPSYDEMLPAGDSPTKDPLI